MTIRKFGYENGTNGAALAVTAFAGDTAFTAVTGADAAFTSTPTPLVGSMAAQSITVGGPGYARWDLDGLSAFSFRKYVYIGAVPSVDLDLIRLTSATGGGGVANLTVRLNSLGALRLVANGGGFPYTTTGAQFPISQWMRLEGFGDCVAQTLRVAAYAQHATSPVVVGATTFDSGALTGVALGTSMNSYLTGKTSNATGFSSTCAWDADEVHTGADVAGFIGPASTALTAGITVTPLSGTVPLAVSSTMTSAGGTGSTVTYAWDWGDGNTTATQSSATATHTYTVAGTYTVTGTVTKS